MRVCELKENRTLIGVAALVAAAVLPALLSAAFLTRVPPKTTGAIENPSLEQSIVVVPKRVALSSREGSRAASARVYVYGDIGLLRHVPRVIELNANESIEIEGTLVGQRSAVAVELISHQPVLLQAHIEQRPSHAGLQSVTFTWK